MSPPLSQDGHVHAKSGTGWLRRFTADRRLSRRLSATAAGADVLQRIGERIERGAGTAEIRERGSAGPGRGVNACKDAFRDAIAAAREFGETTTVARL